MTKISHPVTIVVPVYGDWASLSDCIESLKDNLNNSNQVMLVNDCGPEVEVMEANIKASIKNAANFLYFRNDQNLGFVRTCNRAVLELDKTNNAILLLNSDTVVTPGFLEAMLSVLEADKIGVVSPRSNNATLATVPLSSASQKGIAPDDAYKIFQQIKTKLPAYYIAPVAHGFCMLIRRDLIKKYGLFDEIFGKGYGEEVDFCLRLREHGYQSAICNSAFVFHQEARSFSLEAKAKLLEAHNQIIWQRYPDYRQMVRDYMEQTVSLETAIEYSLGINTDGRQGNKLKRLIKSNKYLYDLAKRAKNRLAK